MDFPANQVEAVGVAAILWSGFVGFVAIYVFIAISRIWLYSKQQVRLLKEIRDQMAPSVPPPLP